LLAFCFHADDGILVFHVTGVQTCALPIWSPLASRTVSATCAAAGVPTAASTVRDAASAPAARRMALTRSRPRAVAIRRGRWGGRSEERRVGKGEGRGGVWGRGWTRWRLTA